LEKGQKQLNIPNREVSFFGGAVFRGGADTGKNGRGLDFTSKMKEESLRLKI